MNNFDDASEDRRAPFWHFRTPTIPPSALILGFGALLVPVLATILVPDDPSDFQVLLWLLSLLPAFTLAFYRGWRGVAFALGIGLAALVGVQVIQITLARSVGNWPLLVGVTVAYLCIALGVGFLSELLHRERIHAERLALTDELTHLPNRRHARLMLNTEFAAARRGRPLAVVFFDLDNLKGYNDKHGHEAGDGALKAFGEVLRTQTRSMNLSGRYDGERFVSIISSTDTPGALVFINRVFAKLDQTPLANGALAVSAGLAAYDSAVMDNPSDLLAAADTALREAKKEGTGTIRVHPGPGELPTPQGLA